MNAKNTVLLNECLFYAKAIAWTIYWSDALFRYTIGHPDADLSWDDRDSAGELPKRVVMDSAFSWGDDARPQTPWRRTPIYEMHINGFAARRLGVSKEIGEVCRAFLPIAY